MGVTMPADAPLAMQWKAAMTNAVTLHANGHRDWRVPSTVELNVLFQNRAAIGGFNASGSETAGWYWSSAEYGNFDAWGQRFSDGDQYFYDRRYVSASLRLVR